MSDYKILQMMPCNTEIIARFHGYENDTFFNNKVLGYLLVETNEGCFIDTFSECKELFGPDNFVSNFAGYEYPNKEDVGDE